MRHRVQGRKLNRNSAHRRALERNLARSLFTEFGQKEHIVTTLQKDKFVKPFVEKLITLARVNNLHNYRRGIQILQDETLVKKLFDEIAPRYMDRPGGYTRVVRIQRRRLGDRATQVLFGFVQDQEAVAQAEVIPEEADSSS